MKSWKVTQINIFAIVVFSFLMFLTTSNSAWAIYVYDKAAEDRRNARQVPCYYDDYNYAYDYTDYDYDYDDYSNVNERYEDYYDEVYRKNCEKAKSYEENKRCRASHRKQKVPPFIKMYVKDYSKVKGHSEFTQRYVQDYSDSNYSYYDEHE